MSDLYCDVSNKNTFGNVRFVCMSNLNIILKFGKIAYNNKKGGQNDYINPNAPKSVLFNRLHPIHPLRRGSIPPLLRKTFRGARLLLLRV
jgi:hypothetical protein